MASTAELAIAVRQTNPRRGIVATALTARQLMKTWAMRGTLHLLHPADAGAYLSLLAATRSWEKASWQRVYVTAAEVAAMSESVAHLLPGRILTREELTTEIIDHTDSPHLAEHLRSGWGTTLKPLAWQGLLCHGPSQGSRVTFTSPATLLPTWTGLPDPLEAATVAIPAYLRAYGPATMDAFDQWLLRGGTKKATLRSWFEAVADRLASVNVEGEHLWLLADDLPKLASTRPSAAVRLLPGFDQYILGPGTSDVHLVAPARRSQVSKTAGWISPILIYRGRVAGVWNLDTDSDAPELKIRLFPEAGKIPTRALTAEVQIWEQLLDQTLRLSVNAVQ